MHTLKNGANKLDQYHNAAFFLVDFVAKIGLISKVRQCSDGINVLPNGEFHHISVAYFR